MQNYSKNILNYLEEIPIEFWSRLKELPIDYVGTLSLAKDISEVLDIEQQLWLINLQQKKLISR